MNIHDAMRSQCSPRKMKSSNLNWVAKSAMERTRAATTKKRQQNSTTEPMGATLGLEGLALRSAWSKDMIERAIVSREVMIERPWKAAGNQRKISDVRPLNWVT